MTGDEAEVASLSGLTEDELLERLGTLLLGDGPGFGPSDWDRKARFARDWLQRTHDDLRRDICGDMATRLKLRHTFESLEDVAAVADALAAALGRPTANIVAVILVRNGLDKLCG
jgi:hypothetical protein